MEQTLKGELHLHLRGGAPRSFFLQQLTRYCGDKSFLRGFPKPLAERLRASEFGGDILKRIEQKEDPEKVLETIFSYRTFQHFLESYILTAPLVRTGEDFSQLLSETRCSLAAQKYDYCEVTVSVSEYLLVGVPLEELLSSLVAAKQDESGPRLCFILDPVRNLGPERASTLLQDILTISEHAFTAVTIGGDEVNFPPEDFTRFFSLAKEAGLKTSVHAGEACGADSVRKALKYLEPDRIGHGVRAAEDSSLVAELAERGIPLEICISSNVMTGVYPNLSSHPLKALSEQGVLFTINTDDPTFFATDLERELEIACSLLGASSREELLTRNLNASFLLQELVS